MSRRLIVESAAEEDLAAAFDWYESQRPGLGGEFVAEVEASLRQIEEYPEAHSLVHSDEVRRCLVNRFPYGVLYIVEQETINVIAVFHAKRDPLIWTDRLRNP